MGRYSINRVYSTTAGNYETLEAAEQAIALQCLRDLQKEGVVFTDGKDVLIEIDDTSIIYGVLFTSKEAYEAFYSVFYSNGMTADGIDELQNGLAYFFPEDSDFADYLIYNGDKYKDYEHSYFYYDNEIRDWHDFTLEYSVVAEIYKWITPHVKRNKKA